MKTVIKMMMKNEIRQELSLLKHYGFIIAVFLLAVLFSKEWILTVIIFIRANELCFRCAVGGVLLAVFLFKKSPLIKITPAAIHYLTGTVFLKKILNLKLSLVLALFILLAAVVTLLSGNSFRVVYFLQLALLLVAWGFLLWRKYQKNSSALPLLGVCVLLIVPYMCQWSALGILIAAAVVIFSMAKSVAVNWEIFFADMKYYSKVEATAARKDYAAMVILANENSVRKSYLVPYMNIRGLSPLMTRSIIVDGLRGPLSMWVMKLLALIASIASFLLSLSPEYEAGIFVLAWSYLIILVTKQSVEAAVTLQAKSEGGLFIPYSLNRIAGSYAVFPILEVFLSSILLAVFTDIPSWFVLLTWIGDCLIIFAWHLAALKHRKQKKWVDGVAGLLILSISFLFVCSF